MRPCKCNAGDRMLVRFRGGASDSTAEDWVADSGVTYNMTRSADMMCYLRPTNDKVSVKASCMIDIMAYML